MLLIHDQVCKPPNQVADRADDGLLHVLGRVRVCNQSENDVQVRGVRRYLLAAELLGDEKELAVALDTDSIE